MTAPTVSVVLPAYQAEKHLAEAVQSILDQTFTDFELLIINDGSTDRTAEIIQSFEDKRIVHIRHAENQKLIASLNEGIAQARGKYIARMDADDISHHTRLQKQVEFLDAHPAVGILGTAACFFRSSSSRHNQIILTEDAELKSRFLFANPFNHPSVMIRKSVLAEHGLSYSSVFIHAEDYALWMELMERCDFANLPEILLDYRYSDDQVTVKHKSTVLESVRKIHHAVLNKIGINPTADQADIHEIIFTEDFHRGTGFAASAEAWLKQLLAANESSGYFPKQEFQKRIGKTWFIVCTSLASAKEKTHKAYNASSLSALYRPSSSDALKFRLKQWLK